MNCRDFQHQLFEYLEESLAPAAQAAAEEHLAECVDCREAVSQQRQFAQSLSRQLHRATAPLQLPHEVERRVLTEVREQRRLPEEPSGWRLLWQRLELPWAMATCALVLLGGMLLVPRAQVPRDARPQPRVARSPVLVQLSYVVPTYTFHREGGYVIDTLTYQTTVVNETRQLELARRD